MTDIPSPLLFSTTEEFRPIPQWAIKLPGQVSYEDAEKIQTMFMEWQANPDRPLVLMDGAELVDMTPQAWLSEPIVSESYPWWRGVVYFAAGLAATVFGVVLGANL